MEKALMAAVQLQLKSAVRTVLMMTTWLLFLLFSPLLTEDYLVRAIVTIFSLVMFIIQGVTNTIRSIDSRDKH
jgi:hypothetical protein